MLMLLAFSKRQAVQTTNSISRSAYAALMMQQGVPNVGYMKERWTENEILALPDGEHDFFERKSGALLGTDNWRMKLSKALSAFANSGGGHIILGQKDDGQFDGVDATRGGTETREWREQVIPPLTSYPLSLFRVHTATPAAPTAIPAGKQVIVIDIGDSPIAPHQASVPNDKRQYYYREGGHSKPAPHHYLEAVRTRFVAAHFLRLIKSSC